LLLVAFLLVNAPNCHLSLVLVSAVQGDAVNCNKMALDKGPERKAISPSQWHPPLKMALNQRARSHLQT